MSAANIGALVWISWPGALGFVLAVQVKRPSRVRFWLIIVVAAVLAFGSLSELGQGDPGGVLALVLPLVILVFVLRRPSRDYFFHRKTATGHLSFD